MTTVIDSVEGLDALDVGTKIHTGNAAEVWERRDGGWERAGAVLSSRYFAGAVSAGLVAVLPPPPVLRNGMVIDRAGVLYIVTGDEEPDENYPWQVERFRPGSYTGPDRIREDFLTGNRVTTEVDTSDESMTPIRNLVAAAQQITEIRRQLTASDALRVQQRERIRDLENQPTPERLPAGLVDALQAYAGEVDDPTFEDLLDRFGWSRKQTVDVTVVITGTNYVTPSHSQAAVLLNINEREIRDVEETARVRWRREFTIAREVSLGGCGCEDVSDEDSDVLVHVPDDSDEWEIDSTSCVND